MQTQPPLVLAVPDLASYQPHTGIGRVFHSLAHHWADRVQLHDASLRRPPLPILRNFPYGVDAPPGTRLVFLPKLTGAQALKDTGGIPSIVVIHDIGTFDTPPVDTQAMDILTTLSIRRSFYGIRHATHIIAVSEFTRDRLAHHLPDVAPRVSVVHEGVDPLFLEHPGDQAAARQRIAALVGQPLGSPLLVYVGSEVPRKNIPVLLSVLRRIRERHPQAQLLKVGKPGGERWRTHTLKTAAALGLTVGEDLLFSGPVDDAALADAYAAADLFVSTSLYEGFGLPPLEAMAVGTPVVVSNRGSFPEIVAGYGRVVDPEVEPFVAAIEQTLAAPHRDQQRQRVRGYAAGFSWARAAERYLELMQQTCA